MARKTRIRDCILQLGGKPTIRKGILQLGRKKIKRWFNSNRIHEFSNSFANKQIF